MGGLANRMRAMAAGLALSRAAGVLYRVVWRENADLSAPFAALLDPEPWAGLAEIVHPNALAYATLYEMPRKRNLYLSAPAQALRGGAFFDSARLDAYRDNPGALVRLVQSRKDALIGSGCVFYPFEDSELRDLFRPSHEVMIACSEWTSQFTDSTLGVHIRRTDNAMSIRHSPTALFVEEIEKWIGANGAHARIFLATDDEQTKADLVQRFGSKIITNDRVASRTTLQGMVDGAAEMFALSRCSAIVGSHYSSYSEMAASIGAVPLRQLFTE